MIHVCFALYDKTGRYSKFTGTTMLSIFDNHTPPPKVPSIAVHILHDNTLTADNRDKFIYLAGQYGQLVKFYNVEELCAKEIQQLYIDIPQVATDRHTIATLYRFFIIKLISSDVEKIIYFDSDIIVNMDINELWRVELGDKVLGVVTEIANYKSVEKMHKIHSTCRDGLIDAEDYFNAGVLLINLNVLRNEQDTLLRGTKFIGENPQYIFLDQDILNYCFSTRTLKLPLKFNRFVAKARSEAEFSLSRKIYHYVSRVLKFDMSDPFNRLWMKYFMRTPWFDVDTMGRLYAGVQQMHVELKQALIYLSALMSGKTRAFFVAPQIVNAVKGIFFVRDDEEIIIAENQTSLQKLIDAMNASRDRKIFFIMLQGFPFGLLNQAGFVAGRDFVNVIDFLSEAHDVPFDSHPLIQAM